MRLIKQPTSILIEIKEEKIKQNKRHGCLLPSSIRCIIVGGSSTGKTTTFINLITHLNGLEFKNVYCSGIFPGRTGEIT